MLFRSRLSQSQPRVVGTPTYTKQDIEIATQKGINEGMARASRSNFPPKNEPSAPMNPEKSQNKFQVAINQQPKNQRSRSLTRQERIQLAADLRLTPGLDEEELPFGLLEQSNPEQPNQ